MKRKVWKDVQKYKRRDGTQVIKHKRRVVKKISRRSGLVGLRAPLKLFGRSREEQEDIRVIRTLGTSGGFNARWDTYVERGDREALLYNTIYAHVRSRRANPYSPPPDEIPTSVSEIRSRPERYFGIMTPTHLIGAIHVHVVNDNNIIGGIVLKPSSKISKYMKMAIVHAEKLLRDNNRNIARIRIPNNSTKLKAVVRSMGYSYAGEVGDIPIYGRDITSTTQRSRASEIHRVEEVL